MAMAVADLGMEGSGDSERLRILAWRAITVVAMAMTMISVVSGDVKGNGDGMEGNGSGGGRFGLLFGRESGAWKGEGRGSA